MGQLLAQWVERVSKTCGLVSGGFFFLFHSSTQNVSYLFLLKFSRVFCVMSHYDLFTSLNWPCLHSCFLISFQCSCRYLYPIAHCLTYSQEFLRDQWLMVSREGEDMVKKAVEEDGLQLYSTSCPQKL